MAVEKTVSTVTVTVRQRRPRMVVLSKPDGSLFLFGGRLVAKAWFKKKLVERFLDQPEAIGPEFDLDRYIGEPGRSAEVLGDDGLPLHGVIEVHLKNFVTGRDVVIRETRKTTYTDLRRALEPCEGQGLDGWKRMYALYRPVLCMRHAAAKAAGKVVRTGRRKRQPSKQCA